MVVVLRGSLDFYRPKGELGFVLAEIDVTALAGPAGGATRRAVPGAGDGRAAASATQASRLPDSAPGRAGGEPGDEGCRDFLGQLTGSGFGFRVSHGKVPVQGPAAPGSIARAVEMLGRAAVTSSRWCEAEAGGRTWPPSIRRSWRSPWRAARAGVDGRRAHGRPERWPISSPPFVRHAH